MKKIKFLLKTSDSFIEIIKAIIISFLILIYSNMSFATNIKLRIQLFDKQIIGLLYILYIVFLATNIYSMVSLVLNREYAILNILLFRKSEIYIICLFRINIIIYLNILFNVLIFDISKLVLIIISLLQFALIYTIIYCRCFYKIFVMPNKKKNRYLFLNNKVKTNYRKNDCLIISKLRTDILIRYKIKSLVIMKVIFVFVSIVLGIISLSVELIFVLNCIFIYIMILCEEDFWKNESMNFYLYKCIGLKYKNYIKVKVIGSFIFNSAIFIILTLFMTRNLLLSLITIFFAVFITIYWSSVFSYIFYLAPYYNHPVRSIAIIGFAITIFIPLAPIPILIILYNKNRQLWNGDSLYANN